LTAEFLLIDGIRCKVMMSRRETLISRIKEQLEETNTLGYIGSQPIEGLLGRRNPSIASGTGGIAKSLFQART
jgi:hypothetical protein